MRNTLSWLETGKFISFQQIIERYQKLTLMLLGLPYLSCRLR